MEKLFCVRPGANADQIKIQLSGARALRVNKDGQLEAETELGPVKFTKPVAYQEIDGKKIDVEVDYTISNPHSQIPNQPTVSRSPLTTTQRTSSSIPCLPPHSWGGRLKMVLPSPWTPVETYM
ncbi:MAG: hypothetical protein AYP45_07880 [Candidatus Brocadia carolinensis]|uniref:DUF7948 domain-containing protein n=1 Tax=Candidatus Brocadia carolinensis TaxID=1004156 RepID=A0A1V4AU52_9BACT|nr:MAG: hypothetical protein AYP45_07880 [Candidatus Brocadia caroliniensis]